MAPWVSQVRYPQGQFVYAIGTKANGAVSFHAMTYYGSEDLQTRYGRQLESFVAGRSCFDYSRLDKIPVEALHALIRRGSQPLDEYVARLRRCCGTAHHTPSRRCAHSPE